MFLRSLVFLVVLLAFSAEITLAYFAEEGKDHLAATNERKTVHEVYAWGLNSMGQVCTNKLGYTVKCHQPQRMECDLLRRTIAQVTLKPTNISRSQAEISCKGDRAISGRVKQATILQSG